MPEDTIIGKKTPHMFVWLCDGKKIGDYDLPLPQGSPNYYQTLLEECKKLQATNTPVYLIYMGRTLNEKQKQNIESLSYVKGLENLFVMDYDDIEKVAPDHKLDQMIEGEIINLYKGKSIFNFIDIPRIVLLYHSDLLKERTLEKFSGSRNCSILADSPDGLFYRDFDVTMKEGEMRDIKLSPELDGFCCSSDHTENLKRLYFTLELFEKTSNREIDTYGTLKDQLIESFYEHIVDPDNHCEIIKQFMEKYHANDIHDINEQVDVNMDEIFDIKYLPMLKNFKKLYHYNLFMLTKDVYLENSILLVNRSHHPIMEYIIEKSHKAFIRKESSADLYYIMRDKIRDKGLKYITLCNVLKNIERYFKVGHDITWAKEKRMSIIYTEIPLVTVFHLKANKIEQPPAKAPIELEEKHASDEAVKGKKTKARLSELSDPASSNQPIKQDDTRRSISKLTKQDDVRKSIKQYDICMSIKQAHEQYVICGKISKPVERGSTHKQILQQKRYLKLL